MKAAVKELLFELNEAVINGEMEALRAYVELLEVAKMVDTIKKGVQEDALEELAKHGQGRHELYGAKVEYRKGGAMYDFKHIPDWVEAKANLAKIEDGYKALYKTKYLGDLAKVGDGEIVDLPVVTYRKDSIAVTLPKA